MRRSSVPNTLNVLSVESLPDCLHVKSNPEMRPSYSDQSLQPILPHEILVIKNFPPVEDEGRFSHVLVDPLVVQRDELVPLGADDDGVGVSGRGVGAEVGGDEGLDPPGTLGADGGLGEVSADLLLRHLQN